MLSEKEKALLQALDSTCGIISTACEKAKVSRRTFYNWRQENPAFAAAAEDILEAQKDFVEGKLLSLIAMGDTSATTFYLRTKAKDRGYTTRDVEPERDAEKANDSLLDQETAYDAYVKELSASVEKNGSDPVIFRAQIRMAARLQVQADELTRYVCKHGVVSKGQRTREAARTYLDPHFNALMQVTRQLQAALRGLGLNNDAKEIKAEDLFYDRIEEIKAQMINDNGEE